MTSHSAMRCLAAVLCVLGSFAPAPARADGLICIQYSLLFLGDSHLYLALFYDDCPLDPLTTYYLGYTDDPLPQVPCNCLPETPPAAPSTAGEVDPAVRSHRSFQGWMHPVEPGFVLTESEFLRGCDARLDPKLRPELVNFSFEDGESGEPREVPVKMWYLSAPSEITGGQESADGNPVNIVGLALPLNSEGRALETESIPAVDWHMAVEPGGAVNTHVTIIPWYRSNQVANVYGTKAQDGIPVVVLHK